MCRSSCREELVGNGRLTKILGDIRLMNGFLLDYSESREAD